MGLMVVYLQKAQAAVLSFHYVFVEEVNRRGTPSEIINILILHITI